MDTLEAIMTRRSIRKYEDRPVPEEMVREILEAAMMAPSAANQQPWQFIVVDDPAGKQSIADINQYAAMATKAPLGILVCGDPRNARFPDYWVQDCSAAIQNMLLAIHAKGLGAVWTGLYPEADRVEGCRKAFNLPEGVIALAYIVIGWPAQHPTAESRFNADRVHRNTM